MTGEESWRWVLPVAERSHSEASFPSLQPEDVASPAEGSREDMELRLS